MSLDFQLGNNQDLTLMLHPIFYLIDGFRHGFFGVSDVSPWMSLAVACACLLVLAVATLALLKSGYKLRA
jgi:ABC-2 type transport system permease protein